uniref:Uncharacterized protein n=1 Tax=Riboviria sp. TaxID=2585031 RepID=A0A6M3YNS4_9VIRU|nr:MAG: hypothetical protein 2 [Riboviria sp.]
MNEIIRTRTNAQLPMYFVTYAAPNTRIKFSGGRTAENVEIVATRTIKHIAVHSEIGSFLITCCYFEKEQQFDGNYPGYFKVQTSVPTKFDANLIESTRTEQIHPTYHSNLYRAISFNYTDVISVNRGVRGFTRGNSIDFNRNMHRLASEFKTSFDIVIRNLETNYITLYVRFQMGNPISTSQMVIRVPVQYQTMYSTLSIDAEVLAIDSIQEAPNTNLQISDVHDFTENVIHPNMAMAAAMIGGGVVEGIGKGIETWARYKMWSEQLGWYKQQQSNQFAFNREYQSRGFNQQFAYQTFQNQMAGYRTESSARGLTNTNTSISRPGLGYVPMNERMDFGSAHYGSPKPFVYSHTQTPNQPARAMEPTSTAVSAFTAKPEPDHIPTSVGMPDGSRITTTAEIHEVPAEHRQTPQVLQV